MKKITITRHGDNVEDDVEFETVTVLPTDTVFFVNDDPLAAHWPTISEYPIGPRPSLPSSECLLAEEYSCRIDGHGQEKGFIRTLPHMAATGDSPIWLSPATIGQPITDQQVVTGGMSPYQISGEAFEVTDPVGAVILRDSGIGPGLFLIPTMNDEGILVSGTPTLSGTYNFTFTVDDAMGGNLQQVHYLMTVD